MIINFALLGIAAIVAAPSTVKAVVSGVEEGRECAKMRTILASSDVTSVEKGGSNGDPIAGVDGLAQAIGAAQLDALGLEGMVATCHELAAAGVRLHVLDEREAATREASNAMAQFLPLEQELARKLETLCGTDAAARTDCLAISELATGPFSPTATAAQLRSRLDDFTAQHEALAALHIRDASVKAIVDELLQMQDDIARLVRDFLAKETELESAEVEASMLRDKMRSSRAELEQQLSGLRLYCDAPRATLAGGEP